MTASRVITILGSTGSIGKNTLDVVSRHQDRFRIAALTANSDVDTLEQQCALWRPEYAAMSHHDSAQQLVERLQARGLDTQVLSGVDGLQRVASLDQVDTVVAGIVGAAGLLPTLAAARAGKRVLLANKEALVMSGRLFMEAVHNNGATLLPVDSEHNAIFQCMPHQQNGEPGHSGINRILLTASGGPFRTLPLDRFKDITPEQAVSHPNWVMGQKISVDSATMMNKGLEVIEAHWLFDAAQELIEVVIHPQSIIHSMVSYADGSILAQLGNPDMRTPIAHCLGWPERIDSGVEPLDIFDVARLEFEKPDLQRFPCLGLCYQAMREGGSASIALNAANEVAVEAFLQNRIAFTAIAALIENVLDKITKTDANTLDEILAADRDAREIARSQVNNLQAV
jgi:1-deoxy-D-xylulose-5-phosphate reductoisomerase